VGGSLAGASLAAAVARAGGLGTIGITTPRQLRTSIDLVREHPPGRAVAVNLLMPFVRRHHVGVCVDARVDAVVLAFGEKRGLVEHLRDAGIFVFVMVGTPEQARAAAAWGADGLIAQGREAGGHLVATMPALDFLPGALTATGVIAGTRFLLTREANATREYQRRIMQGDKTADRRTDFGGAGGQRAASALTRRPLPHQRERETVPVLGPNRLEHRRVQPRVLAHHLQGPARRLNSGVVGLRFQDPAVTNDVVHQND
jgi:NAD(P)H-dependent flavin oxidoreductase YrpB (nitropropane dioxygenase family)